MVHYCDESDIPSGARKIGIREWIQYSIQHQVVKHVFKLVRLVDTQGNISNYYQPTDKNDTRRPFENVLEGYPVDFELMARTGRRPSQGCRCTFQHLYRFGLDKEAHEGVVQA